MRLLGDNAQAYEDRAPWPAAYRRPGMSPPVARAVAVLTAAGGGGPLIPLGINLPNEQELPMGTLTDARQQFERHYLIGILKRHRGNATSAAKEAGKHRSEFYYLLKKHGLTAADYREDVTAPV